jgi:multimeric flavodoxin WrbA
MTLTLLDALPPGPLADALAVALTAELGPVDHPHDLHAAHLAPCKGCFECWTAHPGECGMRDAANRIMADLVGSTEVVWATPVRFGGWDPVAKSALDRMIGLVSPFFERALGETHHAKRYPRAARWGVVAVAGQGESPDDLTRFRALVARNALNLHAGPPWVAVVPPDAGVDALREAIAAARAAPEPLVPGHAFAPPPAQGVPAVDGRPRRALAFIGSHKPDGTSTSEALAGALLDALAARGWEVSRLHVRRAARAGREDARRLVEAAAAADLLILASPIYVDTLPAGVLAGLSALVDAGLPRPPALLPLLQCGFPERVHTTPALELLSAAARRMGAPWAGHLATGGGGALAGAELTRPAGRGWQQAKAIQQAADALDRGEPVPAEVSAGFGEPVVGAAVYRILGDLGWIRMAWGSGVVGRLWATPFGVEGVGLR